MDRSLSAGQQIGLFGILSIWVIMLIPPALFAEPQRPLMRFPDIHDDAIVFVYGEDIWLAPSSGGIAQRLTIHDGEERFPRFSPDGRLITFTGEYDGNADVYVMNRYGGHITRVTYHPGYDQVVGWHPTKNKIMFTSRRKHFRFSKLYLINPDGSGLEEVILHNIAHGSYSPDGRRIAYNKVSREFRTWKRYKGGTAQEVYIYDFDANTDTNVSNFRGTDRIPMWIGDRIYFSSDRDGNLNLYELHPESGAIEQVTHHTEYDVRRPSAGSGKIVYELAGSIWVYDIQTRDTRQVNISIESDAPETRTHLVNVSDWIQGIDLSPAGERALIVARGEIFSVPKKHGPTRNLTQDSGARDKDAVWSPDGSRIAYISDKSGEYNIYLINAKGKNQPQQLTQFRNGYRHSLKWSPDGKLLAFTDQTLTLFVLDIKSRNIRTIARAEYENIDVSLDLKPISDYCWSPDSRYIAYSIMDANLVYQLHIYDLKEKTEHIVSNGLFNDFHPTFSADGKRLFFISNRRFDPTFCDFEWEMVYKKAAGIYCLNLRANQESFFPFESDEVTVKNENKKSNKKENQKSDKIDNVIIDFDGIADRVEAFPLPRGNYRNLAANDKALFYLNKDDGDFNRFEFRIPKTMDLYAWNFEDRTEKSVIKGINRYKLSSDGSHLVYQKNKSVGILKSGDRESKGKDLNLSDLTMWLNPRAEWQQIFNESWRMERDFYYEPNMHGLNWAAMKEKYGKLIPFASCRQDIRFIVGELIGELNTSHTYVFGGDRQRDAEPVNVGMLGADFEIDAAANRYRIQKILATPGWTRGIYPPLRKPGTKVYEGDYILQVNGIDIFADKEIYAYFQNLANKQVTLLVNNKPTIDDAREVVVKPIRSESVLRYLDWAEHNRQVVDKASHGRIGYIHLPDTYTGSAREFPKYFYSQTRKAGLIIDGRFNGGGLDPQIFLQRLQKRPHSYWTRRYSHDQTSPNYAVNAYMVCLTNRQAGSGGDELPFEFQQFNMGPVIGTRSWGGLVGVSMFIGLIDGGGLTAPDYRIYDPDGNWVVENEGVTPDIIIDLQPAEMARGYDAQLMKGVEVLMEKIKNQPRVWPKHPPYPVQK